jgi:hypothetical protein
MIKIDELEDFDKTICLLHTNKSFRGPGMVARNLEKGLKKIGLEPVDSYSSRASKYEGMLQTYDSNFLSYYIEENKKLLLGPNLFVLPKENPEMCKSFSDFVVPSQWVKDLYLQFDLMKGKNINVWSVGIDTEEWTTYPQFYVDEKGKEPDCFIYFKNRSEQDLKFVEAICKKYNISYKVIKYGSYEEEDLKRLCWTSKFAILLTGTESQGIGYMQILSTNTPCYVFNSSVWAEENGSVTCAASSVPYWDDRCGMKTNDINLKHFEEFLASVKDNRFSPVDYILENHTLEKSAKKYYNLLRTMNGDEPVE